MLHNNIMRFIHVFLSISVIFISVGLCNEAQVKLYGGDVKLRGSKKTTVCLDSETVRIELDTASYAVDAIFYFTNYGESTAVTMGFPKAGYGFRPAFKGVEDFYEFETWVDTIEYAFKEIFGDINFLGTTMSDEYEKELIRAIKKGDTLNVPSYYEETHWYIKNVIFSKNESKTTNVRYVSPYGQMPNIEYWYGTGRTWKGKIGKARFIIKSSPKIWLHSLSFEWRGSPNTSYSLNRLSEYECEYLLIDFDPTLDARISIHVSTKEQPWEGEGGVRWELNNKYLPMGKLKTLSLWQLRLLRNTIYAKHGKIFQDSTLNEYFQKTYWYQSRVDFKETDLNKIEQVNVGKILEYEKQLNIKSINE